MGIPDDEMNTNNDQTTKQAMEDNDDEFEVNNVTVEGYDDNDYAL